MFLPGDQVILPYLHECDIQIDITPFTFHQKVWITRSINESFSRMV